MRSRSETVCENNWLIHLRLIYKLWHLLISTTLCILKDKSKQSNTFQLFLFFIFPDLFGFFPPAQGDVRVETFCLHYDTDAFHRTRKRNFPDHPFSDF